MKSLQGSWVKPKDFFDGRITFTDILNKESYRYTKVFNYENENRGYVHLGISLDSYSDATNNLVWRTVIYSIFFIIFGFLISIILSRRLTRQIKELLKTTREIEAGNFKAQAKILSQDEFGFLAHSFNSITSAVSRNNNMLEATVEERTLELGIMNKKLLEEVNKRKKAQSDLHQYAARLETLEEIYKGIISAETPYEVFYNTIENIHKKIIQFTTASLCFFDNEKSVVKVDSFSRLNEQFIKTTKEYSSVEYSGSVKHADDQYYRQNDLGIVVQKTLLEKNLFDEGRKSYISFPLRYQNELIGELIFGFDKKMVIENEIISTLVEISHHVSVAIMQHYFEEKLKIHSEEMKHSLQEKEILLKEIHHRVKNNLQVISSILFLQSRSIKDEKILNLFEDSQNRIRSMALIHEKLYQSKDTEDINFKEYIRGLVEHLNRSYQKNGPIIKTNVYIEDIKLSLDTAISCGLIVNELITNSYKYAFPVDWAEQKSQNNDLLIEVKVEKHEENGFVLIVSDNGIGVPENFNPQDTDSLGLKLVSSIVSQINGSIEIVGTNGTQVKIVFKDNNKI